MPVQLSNVQIIDLADINTDDSVGGKFSLAPDWVPDITADFSDDDAIFSEENELFSGTRTEQDNTPGSTTAQLVTIRNNGVDVHTNKVVSNETVWMLRHPTTGATIKATQVRLVDSDDPGFDPTAADQSGLGLGLGNYVLFSGPMERWVDYIITSIDRFPALADGHRYSDYANSNVTCFGSGTRIAAQDGDCDVARLKVGMQVQTRDNGLRTIRWIGRRKLRRPDLDTQPNLRPIRIMAGALGNGLPERDLLVSRQHRMMLRSKIAERMFGKAEVLVAAIKLTCLPGIFVDEEVESVEYFHLLFDQHEVIYAEGSATESLYTGPQALSALSAEARDEILTLLPEVAEIDYIPEPARPIPTGKRQNKLLLRHQKNAQPFSMAIVSGVPRQNSELRRCLRTLRSFTSFDERETIFRC